MKYFNLMYAGLSICMVLISAQVFGYAIYFVDKNSDPECFNAPAVDPSTGKLADTKPNVVHIFISKSPNSLEKYWKKAGIGPDFIRGLAMSNEYFKKIAPELTKGLAFIPEVGPALSAVIAPVEQIHELLVVEAPKLFNKLFGSLIDKKMREDSGVIAVHWNVPRGDADGTRSSWNWASIQKQNHDKPKGSTLYMTVVGKGNGQVILYNYPFKSDQGVYFIVKKDPKTGACVGIPVNFRDPTVAMPTGPALHDTKFLEEWEDRMNKETLPKMKKNNDPNLATAQAELQRVKDILVRLHQGLPPLPEQYVVPVRATPAKQGPAKQPARMPIPVKQGQGQRFSYPESHPAVAA